MKKFWCLLALPYFVQQSPYADVPQTRWEVRKTSDTHDSIAFQDEDFARDWVAALNEAHENRLKIEEETHWPHCCDMGDCWRCGPRNP